MTSRLIIELGPQQVRLDEVASLAGVKTPALYYHFASRAALIDEACLFSLTRSVEAIMQRTNELQALRVASSLDDLILLLDRLFADTEICQRVAEVVRSFTSITGIADKTQSKFEIAKLHGLFDTALRELGLNEDQVQLAMATFIGMVVQRLPDAASLQNIDWVPLHDLIEIELRWNLMSS